MRLRNIAVGDVVEHDSEVGTTAFRVKNWERGNDFEPATVSGEVVYTSRSKYTAGDFYTAPMSEVRPSARTR